MPFLAPLFVGGVALYIFLILHLHGSYTIAHRPEARHDIVRRYWSTLNCGRLLLKRGFQGTTGTSRTSRPLSSWRTESRISLPPLSSPHTVVHVLNGLRVKRSDRRRVPHYRHTPAASPRWTGGTGHHCPKAASAGVPPRPIGLRLAPAKWGGGHVIRERKTCTEVGTWEVV